MKALNWPRIYLTLIAIEVLVIVLLAILGEVYS